MQCDARCITVSIITAYSDPTSLHKFFIIIIVIIIIIIMLLGCIATIARCADGVQWSVCLSVCLSVAYLNEPCKTAEQIEMPFGWVTRVALRTTYFMGTTIPRGKQQFWGLTGPLKCFVSHCCGICSKKSIMASV